MQYKPFQLRDFKEPSPETMRAAAEAARAEQMIEQEAPHFSEEELLAAQKEAEALGFEKGKAAGRKEAESENARREEQLTAVLDALNARIEGELQQREEQAQAQKASLGDLVLAVTRKLVGDAVAANPLAPIEPMLDECLTMLAGEEHIDIYITEDLVPVLEQHLKSRPLSGKVVLKVVGDASMQVGDCRLRWADGSAERSQEALQKEIEDIIARSVKASASG